MMMTIQSQVGTVILSLEASRLYGEPTRLCNQVGAEREAGRRGQPLGRPDKKSPRKARLFGRSRDRHRLTVSDRWADNRVNPIHKPIKEGQ